MDFKGLLNRALRQGLRSGTRYAAKQLQNPHTRAQLANLLGQGTDQPAPHDSASKEPPPSAQDRKTQRKVQQRAEEYGTSRGAKRESPKQRFPKRPDGGYPGDYTGPIRPVYTPDLDGDADPGEIVWGWVPFEEDHSQGKDRPVLIIGREEQWLLGLMLTSQDNVPGSPGEVHTDEHGSRYINIGSGDWDKQGRNSEIRLDRIIRVRAHDVRREGAIMPMSVFSTVVDAL